AVTLPASAPPPHPSSAESLYMQLRTVGLSKSRVYRVGDVSIDRAAFHITLNDGTIAFTEDVAGCVTGAFFEGDGEILLFPPTNTSAPQWRCSPARPFLKNDLSLLTSASMTIPLPSCGRHLCRSISPKRFYRSGMKAPAISRKETRY